MVIPSPVRNRLLAALPPVEFDRLRPHLRRVRLQKRDILQEPNRPLDHAFFLESGVASLLMRTQRDGPIEVGLIDRFGLVGVPIVLGAMRSPHRCVVQVAGEALRIRADRLRQALEENAGLRRIVMAFIQALFVQNGQIALCNARHRLMERLARRLLLVREQIDGNRIALTHDLLGMTLGVRRAGVTIALSRLEQAGALRRGRGWVEIIDCAILERHSCECHRIISAEYERLIGSGRRTCPLDGQRLPQPSRAMATQARPSGGDEGGKQQAFGRGPAFRDQDAARVQSSHGERPALHPSQLRSRSR